MGAPDVAINGSGSTTVLPGPHRGVVIANTGTYSVYLDHDASVSPTSYDFRLLPGQTVSWEENRPCYGICDVGFNSALSVSVSVGQFTSPPGVSGGAQTNSDLIYYDKMDKFPQYLLGQPGLDVSAYQSLRIRTIPHGALTNANCSLPLYWGNKQSPADYVMSDSFYPSSQAQAAIEIVCDVKAPFLWLNQQTTLFSGATPIIDLEITGYTQRRSPLAYDVYDPINQTPVNGSRIVQITDTAHAIGLANYALPMWSGKMDVAVTMIFSAAPTLLPTIVFNQSLTLGTVTVQGFGDPFVSMPVNTRDYRSITKGLNLGRGGGNLRIFQGAGYVSSDNYIAVTLYGNEDS